MPAVAGIHAIAGVPRVPDVLTVAGLPAIAGIPGECRCFFPAVAGGPAVAGVLDVASIPTDPVHFSAGILYNETYNYRTIGLWLSDCYFF